MSFIYNTLQLHCPNFYADIPSACFLKIITIIDLFPVKLAIGMSNESSYDCLAIENALISFSFQLYGHLFWLDPLDRAQLYHFSILIFKCFLTKSILLKTMSGASYVAFS